eukprot:403341617
MILIGIFNVVFLITLGYLVFKVYKLVKNTDLPQLFSISSLFLSLLFIMIYIILFVLRLRADPESYIYQSNIVRITNFCAVIFFSVALIFDLYKWITFLIATKVYINPSKDTFAINQRKLKLALVITQSGIMAISIVFVVLMFVYDVYPNDFDLAEICDQILNIQFYYVAWLFFVILVILCVVDVWLVQRLKTFYPSFFQKQKKQYDTITDCKISSEFIDNPGLLHPIHQVIALTLGFYLPIGAITYSLMYAFTQKKRLQERQIQLKAQIGSPSLLDEEEMDEKLLQMWDGTFDKHGTSEHQIGIGGYNHLSGGGLSISMQRGNQNFRYQNTPGGTSHDTRTNRGENVNSFIIPNPFEDRNDDDSRSLLTVSDDS